MGFGVGAPELKLEWEAVGRGSTDGAGRKCDRVRSFEYLEAWR